MDVHEAACACGGLRLRAQGAPEYVSSCTCQACQRRTGAPFGVTVFYREDRVEEVGEGRTWRRIAESGNALDYRFCPTCGSTVWWNPQVRPGLVAVAGGCFAEKDFPPPPERLVWADFKADWVEPAPGAKVYPRSPD
jgi:hypothetical protein